MKLCVFTGSRADYGLLKPVMRRVQAAPQLQLQILVSGAHLTVLHGNTIKTIIADGFIPSAEIPLPLDGDSPVNVAEATGAAVSGLARSLSSLSPDILVVLGDRYEALACALAAAILNIPIAHIHGGETTEGAVDEFFRHSITKMSQLHFTSCDDARKRVVQLGEQPDRVFDVGSLGVENIQNIKLLEKDVLDMELGFVMGEHCLLATFHPVTLDENGQHQENAFVAGLEKFLSLDAENKVVVTGPNADVGGAAINSCLEKLVKNYPEQVLSRVSLGQLNYLSVMKYSACVVGNSSSGILEAPSMGIPTVNIGNRQKGRIQASSVISCEPDVEAIDHALGKALSPSFAALAKEGGSPYEKNGTSKRIVEEIIRFSGGVTKPFHDVEFKDYLDG